MPRLLPALAAALFALAALPGPAGAETSELDFAADRYVAGSDIEVDTPTEGDLFAASEDLALEEPVTGATHLAARRLTIEADTGTLYAFAYEIDLDAMVAGGRQPLRRRGGAGRRDRRQPAAFRARRRGAGAL